MVEVRDGTLIYYGHGVAALLYVVFTRRVEVVPLSCPPHTISQGVAVAWDAAAAPPVLGIVPFAPAGRTSRVFSSAIVRLFVELL